MHKSTKLCQHVATLTDCQKEFVKLLDGWIKNKKRLFVLVSGGPGTGKTHTVVETLKRLDRETRVVYMAPTAKLASNIGGRTIHSTFHLNFKNNSVLHSLETRFAQMEDVQQCLKESEELQAEFHLTQPAEIVVIDEAAMLPFWLLYQIVKFFFKRRQPVMVVAMGDNYQLKPVASLYNVFQVPFDTFFETRYVQLRESKRFTPQYEIIVDTLRMLMRADSDTPVENTDENEESENITTFFKYVEHTFPVVDFLSDEILAQASRVLAHTGLTVSNYNKHYINILLKHRGGRFALYPVTKTNRDHPIVNREMVTVLRENCAVMVMENGCGPVFNGTCLTFLSYDRSHDRALCCQPNGNGKVIPIRRSDHTGVIPLVPAFATTIHKFQGETIDDYNVVFNFDQCRDVHLIYTAFSRVRDLSQILAVAL